MNLHEYQAKQLFAEYGLPVSQGIAVDSADEAIAAAKEIGGDKWVIKAQVHAGGRGPVPAPTRVGILLSS
jgi:succinyl-CoA synthetase beta subunit